MAWVALSVWTFTALLGLNLAVRGGAIRLLMRWPWRRRRQRWSHRTLFFNHVLFGAIGLVAWIYRVVTHSALAGWLALGLLALGALHGLGLVERWTPGRGRHATGRSSDHTRTAYFPVLPATGHLMLATATVVLVTAVMVGLL